MSVTPYWGQIINTNYPPTEPSETLALHSYNVSGKRRCHLSPTKVRLVYQCWNPAAALYGCSITTAILKSNYVGSCCLCSCYAILQKSLEADIPFVKYTAISLKLLCQPGSSLLSTCIRGLSKELPTYLKAVTSLFQNKGLERGENYKEDCSRVSIQIQLPCQ